MQYLSDNPIDYVLHTYSETIMRGTFIQCLILAMSVVTIAFVPAVSQSTFEQEALTLVQKEYEQFRTAPRLALIIMSTQNCIGCAMLAVNNAVASLRNYDSTIPCAVVIVTDDARDVATLRHKIASSYIVADTEPGHVSYASMAGQVLPVLAVLSHDVITIHENLQHIPPDFSQLFAWSAETPEQQLLLASAAATHTRKAISIAPFITTLEEPKDRSIKYLMSPVLSASRDKLYGINHLTNSIEVWDVSSGALLEPITATDRLKYFFRKNERDTVWKITERQGYDPARFIALRAVDDTVYALAILLAGYERERSSDRAANGSDSTTMSVYWITQQVAVKIYDHAIQSITPLPEKYSFIELLADRTGAIGGTCIESVDEGMEAMSIDSLAVVALLEPGGYDRIWKAPASLSSSLGSAAMSPEGTIWYCDPLQPVFFVARAGHPATAIPLQKQLLHAGSPLLLDVPEDMKTFAAPPFAYFLESMKAWDDKVAIFLSPTDTAAHVDRLVQTYRDDGTFLGEVPLRAPVIEKAAMAWLVDVQENMAIVLAENNKRWQLAAIPLSQP